MKYKKYKMFLLACSYFISRMLFLLHNLMEWSVYVIIIIFIENNNKRKNVG
jgi:hypothetical protein